MKECMQDTEGLNRLYGINKYENHIFEPNLSYNMEIRLKKLVFIIYVCFGHAFVERYEDKFVNFALLVLQVREIMHSMKKVI